MFFLRNTFIATRYKLEDISVKYRILGDRIINLEEQNKYSCCSRSRSTCLLKTKILTIYKTFHLQILNNKWHILLIKKLK